MAINKTINKRINTHGAMRNCIEYVLRQDKTNELFTYVTGPYCHDEINYDLVYRTFLEEKKMWDKDSGRMYAHNIISWHKDEQITLEQAFEFGKEFAEKLQIQVNKSSVEAVDEAQKKQKEAEKKMEQAESKARNEKKRAELEIRKAKKEVKDRTENMKAMEYFWGMGYIMVVLFAILQNGAFQDDFIDFFMTPFMWYVRFCKWLVYPTYDNGFNQKVAYTGGEVWGIRILAIVAVLFIVGILMVIIMETIKQYKKMWNEISQMFLIGSLSGIAVLGDVIRGYLPVNLILLFVFINVGIMLLIMYLRKSLITYSLTY